LVVNSNSLTTRHYQPADPKFCACARDAVPKAVWLQRPYFVVMQLPTTTTSQYQAAANPLQTVGALGTAAGGFGTLMGGGKKEGGAIKLAKGGITDVDALEGMAEDLSIPQIQQSMQNETLPKYVGMPILEQKVNEAERMKMAQAMMGTTRTTSSLFLMH
jgi:hypothetical protein